MRSKKKFRAVNITDMQTKAKLMDDVIWILMFIFSAIHGLMTISQGILSSYVTEIKEEFSLSYSEYSLFGTISGLGSLLGSIVFTLIIEKVSNKYLISSMLIINCLSHFSFVFKLKYHILLVSRFTSGFASVFCYIYFPMWVDKFGIKSWLNFMQTTIQVSNTIGHILGYFIFYKLGNNQWKYGFLSEIFSVLCFVFVLILLPENYYNKDYEDNSNYQKINTEEEVKLEGDSDTNNSIIIKSSIKNDIMLNLPYICLTLYRSNRLFIFIVIDFWFSDYLQNTLLETNSSTIFLSYSLTIVIAPLLGLIFGGILSNKIGGPKGKNSFITMFYLQLFSVIFGLFSYFFTNVNLFTIFMSLYMLLNTAAGLISISASYAIVPENLIGITTGIYSIFVNLTGFLPGPFAYAFMKNIFSSGRYIDLFLMVYGFIGCIDLYTADFYMKTKKIMIYK